MTECPPWPAILTHMDQPDYRTQLAELPPIERYDGTVALNVHTALTSSGRRFILVGSSFARRILIAWASRYFIGWADFNRHRLLPEDEFIGARQWMLVERGGNDENAPGEVRAARPRRLASGDRGGECTGAFRLMRLPTTSSAGMAQWSAIPVRASGDGPDAANGEPATAGHDRGGKKAGMSRAHFDAFGAPTDVRISCRPCPAGAEGTLFAA